MYFFNQLFLHEVRTTIELGTFRFIKVFKNTVYLFLHFTLGVL